MINNSHRIDLTHAIESTSHRRHVINIINSDRSLIDCDTPSATTRDFNTLRSWFSWFATPHLDHHSHHIDAIRTRRTDLASGHHESTHRHGDVNPIRARTPRTHSMLRSYARTRASHRTSCLLISRSDLRSDDDCVMLHRDGLASLRDTSTCGASGHSQSWDSFPEERLSLKTSPSLSIHDVQRHIIMLFATTCGAHFRVLVPRPKNASFSGPPKRANFTLFHTFGSTSSSSTTHTKSL